MAVPVLLAAVHAAPAPWAAAPPTPGPQASRHRPEADRLEVLALLALVRLEAVLRSALDLLAAELRRQALLLVLPAQVRLVTAPLGLALLAAIHGSEAGKTKTRGELRKVNHMRRGEKSSNNRIKHSCAAPRTCSSAGGAAGSAGASGSAAGSSSAIGANHQPRSWCQRNVGSDEVR